MSRFWFTRMVSKQAVVARRAAKHRNATAPGTPYSRSDFVRPALALCALALCGTVTSTAATPPQIKIVYGFGAIPDSAYPNGALVMDTTGRLYGVSAYGGRLGYGTIFRLTRPSSGSGQWAEEILYTFSGPDGAAPNGSLIFDSSGMLYGTTSANGGEVFQFDPGTGSLVILHNFASSHSVYGGYYPESGVIFGPGGLLYGTTESGGSQIVGVAYSINPSAGSGSFSVVHNFQAGNAQDGANPVAGLIVASNGSLLGTTSGGGAFGGGTVFSLTLNGEGTWVEKTVYSFNPAISDVTNPASQGDLIRGPHNSFYGCGTLGGQYGLGGVFRLVAPGPGDPAWTESTIFNFSQLHVAGPCGLTLEPSGNVLGTSAGYGYYDGTIFELYPPTSGTTWTSAILEAFSQYSYYGYGPTGPLLRNGTVYFGSNGYSLHGGGVTIEFKP